jgi:hypothetical protein
MPDVGEWWSLDAINRVHTTGLLRLQIRATTTLVKLDVHGPAPNSVTRGDRMLLLLLQLSNKLGPQSYADQLTTSMPTS